MDFLKIVGIIVVPILLFAFTGNNSTETGLWLVIILPFLLVVSLIVWIMRRTSGGVKIGKRDLKISQKSYLVILIILVIIWLYLTKLLSH